MKYKLISKTDFNGEEYTVYKVLCKEHWYLPWKGITFDGSLQDSGYPHKWYGSKMGAIKAFKTALKEASGEVEVQKNYPIIREERIEL